MSKSEAAVQSEILADAPKWGGSLERNNVGACTDETGRIIRYGLGNVSALLTKRYTSSDLIGDVPQMGLARSVAIECKHEAWTNPFPDDVYWKGGRSPRQPSDREVAQYAFIRAKRARGWIAGFATSVNDVRDLMIDHGVNC